MSTETIRLASEATKIRENEAVQYALAALRAEALETLANTSPTDADAIHKHQATVRVIDEFFGKLDALIRDAKPKNKPGIV